jgi:O-antigen ligase
MKNKIKYLLIVMIIVSITYLLVVALTLIPILTFLATMILLLSVLFMFILAGKIDIVKDKKTNRFFLQKNKQKK